jgi:hypothetical protein
MPSRMKSASTVTPNPGASPMIARPPESLTPPESGSDPKNVCPSAAGG